jgi:hypothetical protein
MNLKNQLPIFVPITYLPEFEKLSKSALMDMVWDYAAQIAGDDPAISEFRARRDIILTHRKNARGK